MLSEAPEFIQIGSYILGAVVGIAGLTGLIAGAIYIVKSRQITTNNALADSAVASLQAANLALESRLTSVERDNEHCIELKRQQDSVIASLNKRVDSLIEDVTQRAAVAEFRDEVRGFLVPMAAKLGIDPDERPPVHLSAK